jgi:excisionase family DNA binding protein
MASDRFASTIASEVAATVLRAICVKELVGEGLRSHSKAAETSASIAPLLLRVGEAAVVLANTPSGVRHLIERGQLRAVRHGRAVRIAVDDLLDFIARGRPQRGIKLCSSNCKRKRG